MKAIYAAFVKAQAELGVAIKDSTNPHFKSRYADLSSVVAAVKPVFAKHGLAYIQKFAEAQGGVAVESVVVHETGEQFSTGVLFVPATKQDAQGYGSAITYARRYSLQTAAGIPADDDDGNAASASAPKISPVKSALAELSDESMAHVQNVADAIVEAVAKSDDKAVFALAESLDSDQRVYLWSLWQDDSKLRSKVKRIVDTMRQVAAQAAPEKVAA